MQSTIYSVIRFRSWYEGYGTQKAGLPQGSLDPLYGSSVQFMARAAALRNDLLHVKDAWQKVIDSSTGANPAANPIVKAYVQAITVDLVNLRISTGSTTTDAAGMRVKVIEANSMVQSYIARDSANLTNIEMSITAAQQHMQTAQLDLQRAKAELSGSKGFWNGFITGITFTAYNPLQENINKANNAVARYNSELNNQINLRNQQIRIINERSQADGLLSNLISIDGLLTEFQNSLNSALTVLSDAQRDEQKYVTTSNDSVAKYYFKALGKDMDRLFIWMDGFFRDNVRLRSAGAADLCSAVRGTYECHKYDAGGKNDWHYVTIVKLNDQSVMWTNQAGVNWILNLGTDADKLSTGTDCPYYDSYKEARVVFQGNMVSGIIGPNEELYEKAS